MKVLIFFPYALPWFLGIYYFYCKEKTEYGDKISRDLFVSVKWIAGIMFVTQTGDLSFVVLKFLLIIF